MLRCKVRRLLQTTILLLLCYSTQAQKNKTTIDGTVAIDSVTSMDKTETTIREWILFIVDNDFDSSLFPDADCIPPLVKLLFSDLKKKSDFEYIKIFGKQNKASGRWVAKGIIETPALKELAASDTLEFSTYNPVTGISWQQAQRYCAWHEKRVNEARAVRLHISLPTVAWLNKLNRNKDSVCAPEVKCDSCTGYQLNYAHKKCKMEPGSKANATQGQGVLRADYYWPSKEGLYNIQGNVAEMTEEEGVAVGGSFRHFAAESYSGKVQRYTRPQDWLGFRCLVSLE